VEKLVYTTVAETFMYEIPKIKGSKFFGTVFFVETKEQAEAYVVEMNKNFHDATHNCYAYRIGIHVHQDLFGNTLIDPKWSKANDDGEPSNTAGKPILSVLEAYQVQNTLLVVTRYFGGTLLGVGGLIQAYTLTAQETLKHARLIQQEIFDKVELSYSYTQTSLLAYLFEKYEVKVLEQIYDVGIQQKLQINRGYSEAFKKELLDKSGGSLIV
jgi:uncharacterized YigZ family protein